MGVLEFIDIDPSNVVLTYHGDFAGNAATTVDQHNMSGEVSRWITDAARAHDLHQDLEIALIHSHLVVLTFFLIAHLWAQQTCQNSHRANLESGSVLFSGQQTWKNESDIDERSGSKLK